MDLWCEGQPSFRVTDAKFDAAEGCWIEFVLGVPRRIENATHWMPRPEGPGGEPCDVEVQPGGSSFSGYGAGHRGRWTMVYGDSAAEGLVYYVRFVPDFMDLEAAGFPHGLSIGNVHFASEDEAKALANAIEAFCDRMLSDIVTELPAMISKAGIFVSVADADKWLRATDRIFGLLQAISDAPGRKKAVAVAASKGLEQADVLFRSIEAKQNGVMQFEAPESMG